MMKRFILFLLLAAAPASVWAGPMDDIRAALKDNDLTKAAAAADTLTEARDIAAAARLFESKKVYGAKLTIKYYEKAIKLQKDPRELAFLKRRYGLFLKSFTLADEKKCNDLIDSAFNQDPIPLDINGALNYVTMEPEKIDFYSKQLFKIANAEKRPVFRANNYYAASRWTIRAYYRTGNAAKAEAELKKALANPEITGTDKIRLYTVPAEFVPREKVWQAALDMEKNILPKAKENVERLIVYSSMIGLQEKAVTRFYLPPDPIVCKKIITTAQAALKLVDPQSRVEYDLLCSWLKAANRSKDVKLLEEGAALLAQSKRGAFDALGFQGRAAYLKGDYQKAVEYLEAAVKGRYEESAAAAEKQKRKLQPYEIHPRFGLLGNADFYDMLIRSCVAVGDYKKAMHYKDYFMQYANRPTRNRYDVYFTELQKRVDARK